MNRSIQSKMRRVTDNEVGDAPPTLGKGAIGEFQRGVDAYLKKRGLVQHSYKRRKAVGA